MLNVANKPIMLSVIMLNVVKLSFVAPYSQHFIFSLNYEWAQLASVSFH